MRTLRHWIIASVVIIGLALGVVLSAIANQGGKPQTLSVAPAAASANPPANPGGPYRPTAGHGPGVYTDSQLAQVYLEDGPFIDNVTQVAIKRSTWGDISSHVAVPGFKVGGPDGVPTSINPNKVYDIIVQVGHVVSSAVGPGANNHTYTYVVSVVDPNNFGPGFTFSDPNLPWQSYWGQIHGQETDASQ